MSRWRAADLSVVVNKEKEKPSRDALSVLGFHRIKMTTELSSLFELWCTPTISLSLVIESERPEPTWLRSFSRFALYFRPLLRPTLEYEISQRGSASNVISATTLRVVDSAHWRSIQSRVRFEGPCCFAEAN